MLTAAAVILPLIPIGLFIWVAPRIRQQFYENDTPVPTIVAWLFSPGFQVACFVVYGMQLVALVVCLQVGSMRRYAGPVALLTSIGWILLSLLLVLGLA